MWRESAHPGLLRGRSFRSNSMARLASDVYALLSALAAATITARLLGPAGRGFYSTLMLLAILFVQVFNAGLGEAAVVFSGRKQFPLPTIAGATACAVVPLAAVCAPLFFIVATVTLDPRTADQRTAIVLGAILVVLNVVSTTIVWFFVLQERIVLVAVLATSIATLTTLALALFVGVANLGATGAVLGSLVGLGLTLVAMVVLLRRSGIPVRPRWNAGYLTKAVRYGGAVQLSNLLVQMTGRLDLVLVYRLSGSTAAGRYSVSLTVGALVSSVPTAVAFASFPRLAQLDQREARALTVHVYRRGMAAAIGSAVVLAVATPVILPVIFGPAYANAIAPTLVLIPGGIMWSGQWLLGRAAAASGSPRVLFVSYAVSFAVMIVIDLVAIPRFGILGAAFGALIASGSGLAVTIAYYGRWGWLLREFLPRPQDLADLAAALHPLLDRRRSSRDPLPAGSPVGEPGEDPLGDQPADLERRGCGGRRGVQDVDD